MSYHVFFALSTGLKNPILVPQGTLKVCQDHVARVERVLGFEVTRYKDNPAYWKSTTPRCGVHDETFCKVAKEHNEWVRWFYGRLCEWCEATPENPPKGAWYAGFNLDKDPRLMVDNYGKPSPPPDTLTPEDAQTFWRGLQIIDVPVERWTEDYYRNRMEHLYEVMRGREHEGVTFDERALTPKQAAAVIGLFEEYLDDHDLRLEVPNGCDYLASSSDGGYDWCEKCGPMNPDHVPGCRRKACPLRAERDAEEPKEYRRRWVVKDKAKGVYLGRTPGEWPAKLTKRVLMLNDRDAAEAQVKLYPKRALVVVPVRPA